MKYHITITNNETGEIVHDYDTNAVIGGFSVEGGAAAIGLTACPSIITAFTIAAAQTAINKIREDNPKVVMTELILSMKDALDNGGDTESDDEEGGE